MALDAGPVLCAGKGGMVKKIDARLDRLERARGQGDVCECATERGVSGWRTTYRGGGREADSDLVERCARCGKVRNMIAVEYVAHANHNPEN